MSWENSMSNAMSMSNSMSMEKAEESIPKMSQTDLKDVLHQHLMDEYKDVIQYNDLSQSVDKKYSNLIKKIAKEEMNHAKIIEDIIIDAKLFEDKNILEMREKAQQAIM